jgi:hypothetical protein
LLELDALLDDFEEVASVFESDPQPARAMPSATTARAVPQAFKGVFMESPVSGNAGLSLTVGKGKCV